jgi:hypothetical protein
VGLLTCPLRAAGSRPLLLLLLFLGVHLLLPLRPRRCSPWRQSHSVVCDYRCLIVDQVCLLKQGENVRVFRWMICAVWYGGEA